MNREKPLVTIITAVLNGEKYLEETILSVLNQSYSNIEYIVIDGGSTDRTPEIIRKYSDRLTRWISEPDEGLYDAVNKGLVLSTGDIAAYINYDDLYFDDKVVERVVELFRSRRDIDWVFSDYSVINEKSEVYTEYRVPERIVNYKMMLSAGFSYISQPTTFWSERALKSAGYFDKSYRMAADYDFMVKMAQNFKVAKCSFPVAKVRFHGETLTEKYKELNLQEVSDIREKHSYSDSFTEKLRRFTVLLFYKTANFRVYIKRLFGGGSK